jgi:hypothetical protein
MRRFSLPAQKDEPTVDPDALRAFAAGAKEHSTKKEPPPWESHDPDAMPRHNVSVRLNDYQLAMVRYLAECRDISQQKVLNRILIPAIEEQAKELVGG